MSLEEPEPRLEHCIEFMVRGNPPPTLHWLHNGQPLRESKIIRVEFYQEGEVAEGCLLFNKPTHYNNGNYTLIAKNPLGTANQTINGHFLKEPFPGEALRSGAPRVHPGARGGGWGGRIRAWWLEGTGSSHRNTVTTVTQHTGARGQPPPAFCVKQTKCLVSRGCHWSDGGP